MNRHPRTPAAFAFMLGAVTGVLVAASAQAQDTFRRGLHPAGDGLTDDSIQQDLPQDRYGTLRGNAGDAGGLGSMRGSGFGNYGGGSIGERGPGGLGAMTGSGLGGPVQAPLRRR